MSFELSPFDILEYILAVAGGVKWWLDRRDARSALAEATRKAEEALAKMTEARDMRHEQYIETKEDRDYWRSEARYQQERADTLWQLLYPPGAPH